MILSIVLTVYNKKQYLRRALSSLLGQEEVKHDDYEILIVNDGSTDGSDILLEEYSRTDSRVRVLHQDNQGLSMARNNGAEAANGDYVWFVDADDTISGNSVRLITEAISSHPDVIPICSKFVGDENVHNNICISVKTGKEVLLDNWEHCGVFWVMRREFLSKNNLRFFPGIYHEDAEFTPRMLYFAKSVCVVPEVLYFVDCVPNSITQVPRPKRAFDCLVVAEHLYRFTEENNERGTPIGRVLDYNISVLINNGLDVIVRNSKEEQQTFNAELRRRKELTYVLSVAPRIKYRIEAFLFFLFPRHYVSIYKVLKLFR